MAGETAIVSQFDFVAFDRTFSYKSTATQRYSRAAERSERVNYLLAPDKSTLTSAHLRTRISGVCTLWGVLCNKGKKTRMIRSFSDAAHHCRLQTSGTTFHAPSSISPQNAEPGPCIDGKLRHTRAVVVAYCIISFDGRVVLQSHVYQSQLELIRVITPSAIVRVTCGYCHCVWSALVS